MASLCHPCQQGACLLPRWGGLQASLAQLTRGDGCAMEVLAPWHKRPVSGCCKETFLRGPQATSEGRGPSWALLCDLVSIPSVCEPLVQV